MKYVYLNKTKRGWEMKPVAFYEVDKLYYLEECMQFMQLNYIKK